MRKYSGTSLQKAREKWDEVRVVLAGGGDPGMKREIEKSVLVNTFEAIAKEWREMKRGYLTESNWQRDRDQLMKMVGPYLGKRPISSIEASELLAVLRGAIHSTCKPRDDLIDTRTRLRRPYEEWGNADTGSKASAHLDWSTVCRPLALDPNTPKNGLLGMAMPAAPYPIGESCVPVLPWIWPMAARQCSRRWAAVAIGIATNAGTSMVPAFQTGN